MLDSKICINIVVIKVSKNTIFQMLNTFLNNDNFML